MITVTLVIEIPFKPIFANLKMNDPYACHTRVLLLPLATKLKASNF